jgi:Zn-finger nucleic acid-binding protein
MADSTIEYTPCPRCQARSLDLRITEQKFMQKVRNFGERWPSYREVTQSSAVVVCLVCGLEMPLRLRAG